MPPQLTPLPRLTRRRLLAAAPAGLAVRPARAAASPLGIGLLSDMHGPLAALSGTGALAAARQALADAGDTGGGPGQVRIVQADHRNDPAVAETILRQWFAEGIGIVADCPNSGVALRVAAACRDANRVFLATTPGSVALTTTACSPNTLHWAADTWTAAHTNGMALIRQGLLSWFFIGANTEFSRRLVGECRAMLGALGGTARGETTVPAGTTDYRPALAAARASGAQVVALAIAGEEAVNCILQARGVDALRGLRVAGLMLNLADIHALGPAAARDLIVAESYYWDTDRRTRRLAEHMAPALGGGRPSSTHALAYAAILHALRTARRTGLTTGRELVAAMKRRTAHDDAFGATVLRADGRALHDIRIFQVKPPEDSTGPWDLYRLVYTIPASDAFRPDMAAGCAF